MVQNDTFLVYYNASLGIYFFISNFRSTLVEKEKEKEEREKGAEMNNRKKEPWTKKEIDALLAGVGKYGQQWKKVVLDPDFGPILCRRFPYELKNEWRKAMGAMHVSRPKIPAAAPAAAAAAEAP